MKKQIGTISSIALRFTRLLLVICLFQMYVSASTRHALVIGNDSYPGNKLQNARNDAKSIAEQLKILGYRTTLITDADRVSLASTIQAFSESIASGDLALVYYAGHGLQVAGENYLVPIDFHVSDEADAVIQGYPLSGILEKLTIHGAKTEVIILDACRDNPFLASRSTASGWASRGTSLGAFLAFGTSPGSTASDDPGEGHGLFTKALLAHLAESGIDIDGLFNIVRSDVVRESKGHQVPWAASSLLGSLHLNPIGDLSSPKLANMNLNMSGSSTGAPRSVDTRRNVRNTLASPEGDEGSQGAEVTELLTEAQKNLRGLNISKAIGILQTVLAFDPRSSIALRLLAVAFHLVGRGAESEEAINRAISIDPQDGRTYTYSCLILATRDSQRVRQDCDTAVGLQDDSSAAHLGLSFAAFVAGEGPKSYSEATRALKLDPTATEAVLFRQNVPVQRY